MKRRGAERNSCLEQRNMKRRGAERNSCLEQRNMKQRGAQRNSCLEQRNMKRRGAERNSCLELRNTGGWKEVHNEKHNNLWAYASPIIMIKSSRRWAGYVARMES
jgi:hypothetical protein